MSGWNLAQVEHQESNTATCSRGTANGKGSYAQIVASTGFAYDALSFQLNGSSGSGGGQTYLVDIAVGGAGSESVIVPNVLLDCARGTGMTDVNIWLPCAVPAGSRLAVRCQETGGAGTRQVTAEVNGRAGGWNMPASMGSLATNYGANTGTTNGVLIDQGASANAFGSWIQMTASTSRDHNCIVMVMGTDQQISGLGGWYFFQLAVGGSGSEQVVAEFQSSSNTNDTRLQTNVHTYFGYVPAGTRLSMRAKCNAAAAGDRHATAILLAM